jgi:N-acetylneuraminic acid mutarotase
MLCTKNISGLVKTPFRSWLASLAIASLALTASGATLTVSNDTSLFDGYHGVADNSGVRLSGSGSGGFVGRMNLSDSQVTAFVNAGNMSGLNAAFTPFGGESAKFELGNIAQGAFQVSIDQSTKASLNSFGDSNIYVWLFKGGTRTTATEYLLMKLNATFATDPEDGPSASPDEVYLRPAAGTLFAGFVGPQTHNYDPPNGVAATIFRMMGTGPVPMNQPPVASNGTLAAVAEIARSGQLSATDPENSTLSYSKTVDPSKGTVVVQSNGSFVYTASAGETGADSFKFKANDGQADSNEGTISITISARPVADSGTLAAITGVAKNGQLTGSDAGSATLTYSKTADPSKGSVVIQTNGSFVYTATAGQLGADSFKFKVNNGTADSREATISITISAPPNQPPVGLAARYDVGQNDRLTGVLQGSDAESQTMTFSVGDAPSNGNLVIESNGAFTYVPNHEFIGDDSFTFVVNDGQSNSVPVQVVVLVRAATLGWAWMNGESAANLNGVYGTADVGSPGNRPGARSLGATASWGGKIYVFGGLGRGEIGAQGLLNDLWEFDSEVNEWTWMSGGKGINAAGQYGTQGTGAVGNVPGGRSGAALWVDGTGRVWMFGGFGRGNSVAAMGELNDLWRYDPTSREWTWISGLASVGGNSSYGVQGQAGSGNTPGARSGSLGWQDGSGRLWLFGGRGRGVAGTTSGFLNDLWRFDTESAEWTHCHGSQSINVFGKYGIDGVEVVDQGPGGRTGATGWMDSDGMMWLFGGQGLAASGSAGFLNDLWVFDPESGAWRGGVYRSSSGRWRTSPGMEKTNVAGVNGTLGVAADANFPSARSGAVASRSADGKLLLFGGAGAGAFNDVWAFDPASSQWTWLKGAAKANQAGVYGQKGVASASNTPGARSGSAGFVSPTGHLWVFGGAAGTQSFGDGWRLRLRSSPSSRLETVVASGETSVDVSGKVRVNVGSGSTTVVVEFRSVGATGAWGTVSRPVIAPNPSDVSVGATLTGLLAGTTYDVRMRVSNASGEALSLTKRVTTNGVAAAGIVASFVSSSSSFDENRGVARVEVRLSAPAPSNLTLPIAVTGGTGDLGMDFFNPSSVVFLPGQTRSWALVSVFNDLIQEGNETIQLGFGVPSLGSVSVGVPTSHTLEVRDDDGEVTVGVASVLAEMGKPVVLVSNVNSSLGKRYQWKKAGVKITGATSSSLSIAKAALADAGNYSVDVTLSSGAVRTGTAGLAVVDTAARRVLGQAGFPVTLGTSAAGPSLSYVWRKVSSSDVVGSLVALVFSPAMVEDSGDYECTVEMTGVGALECAVSLNMVTAAPVMTLPRLPNGYVGATYGFQLVPSNVPSGEADTFVVTGLPKGMIVNAKGWISGVPTAPVVDKPISILASNPNGSSVQIQSLLTIQPLPAALVGTYGATFGPISGMPGGGVGGKADFTVSSSGSFSATLISGTDSRTAKGPVVVAVDGTSMRIAATFVKKGAANIVIDWDVVGAPATGELEVSGTITESGSGHSGNVEGVKLAPFVDARVGRYTFGLLLNEASEDVLVVPQGDGFGTCTVATTGRVTFVGNAADGTAYTASAVMGREGDVPVFLGVASVGTAGGLAGMAEVRQAPLNNGLEGSLTWTRAGAASTAKTRSYRAGFSGVEVEISGGLYQGPVTGGIIVGLPTGTNNVTLSFDDRAMMEGNVADFDFTIANGGGVKQKVTVSAFNATLPVNPNPASIQFVLDSKVAGAFSGTFTLPGATKALNRKATYRGMFVRRPMGSFFAAGYYLIARPTEPGLTVALMPELSGQIQITGNP